MPDLSNLLNSSAFPLPPCNSIASSPTYAQMSQTLDEGLAPCQALNLVLGGPEIRIAENGVGIAASRQSRKKLARGRTAVAVSKSLEDHVKDWVEKKVAAGVPERDCFLPFLINAPKMVECRICSECIHLGEEISCSVYGCREAFHIRCAEQRFKFPESRRFKCPQHSCFICKKKGYWRCTRCIVAAHTECAPWPDKVIYPAGQPGRAVCWRHPTDWRMEKKAG